MKKDDLSKKLIYILNELNMNKTEFLNACQQVNPFISKPTILNIINGKTKGFPKIETIDTIINVCKNSDNKNLKQISYDYLLNESNKNISNENIKIGNITNLSDTSISLLRSLKYPENSIPDDFISNIDQAFWTYLLFNKQTNNILIELKKVINNNNFLDIKIKDIKQYYYDFKKDELLQSRNKMQTSEYKKYLISLYPFNNAKEQTITELETNLLMYYTDTSKDLFDVVNKYITTGKLINQNYKKDITKFLNYLKSNQNNLAEINIIIESTKNLFYTLNTTSTILIMYLRDNFSNQSINIKKLQKDYKELSLYTKNGFNLFYDNLKILTKDLTECFTSLSNFSNYLQLTINNTVLEYTKRI